MIRSAADYSASEPDLRQIHPIDCDAPQNSACLVIVASYVGDAAQRHPGTHDRALFGYPAKIRLGCQVMTGSHRAGYGANGPAIAHPHTLIPTHIKIHFCFYIAVLFP